LIIPSVFLFSFFGFSLIWEFFPLTHYACFASTDVRSMICGFLLNEEVLTLLCFFLNRENGDFLDSYERFFC
jgi:hypothetical protein